MYTPGMSVMSLLLKNRYESKRSRDLHQHSALCWRICLDNVWINISGSTFFRHGISQLNIFLGQKTHFLLRTRRTTVGLCGNVYQYTVTDDQVGRDKKAKICQVLGEGDLYLL
jgi:hypothetical protein